MTADHDAAIRKCIDAPDDYPVVCDCGWFGFRFDCLRGLCPNCGDRVRREKE
jgi:hypothetical protein